MDRRSPTDRHGPKRKRNPRASRPPLIPSANLNTTKATATARKSIPASIQPPSVPSVTGKQSQNQQLMEPIDDDDDSSKASEVPQKKVLQQILDTLQSKDTYDIFAEPVDPNEVNLSCHFILTFFPTCSSPDPFTCFYQIDSIHISYDRRCSPFFQADNKNPFAVNSFKADSNPFAVNSFKPFFQADCNNPFAVNSFKADSNPFAASSFKPHVDASYRESLLSFVKELGPKAKMVAARKLQSADLLDIGAGSGGAASPGLFLKSYSLPNTTEPSPRPAPAPPQQQSTTTTTAAARSDMGGASSPGLFFRDYSHPPTTKPPSVPYKPLPLQPQSTMTTTARRSDMGGASSPGLFFRDYSIPSTTEPPALLHKPLPLQPQSTMTKTARRSDMGGASSPGFLFRDYSLPLTTEQPPPLHRPLPLQPQPTMATTRRAETASPGLFFRNNSLHSATTEPPPPLPPQPKPTITPPQKNEKREAAGHGPHPSEENVRPVILALEYPHANHHALESRKEKNKRNRLLSTHNDESIDRGHSQAVNVDSGQKQHKKPKSPSPPPPAAAPSFPFDMCFLKAKLDRMGVQRSPIGMKGDNKFATGLQSWTSNPILADQKRFF